MGPSNVDADSVDATDGVTLRKCFEDTEYQLPSIEYRFTSDRDEPVAVTVIETIPETLDPGDIGFMGSHATDAWHIKGPKVVFEDEIEPNEEYTTACAARGGNADTITDLLGRPEVFEVEPPAESREAADSPAPFTRSAGTRKTPNGPAESRQDVGNVEAAPAPAATDSSGDRKRERVVEQFVSELQSGDVSEESVEFLRAELGSGSRPRRTVETRVKHLQNDVADMRAYVNTLETFIDEYGSAEEVVEAYESRLQTLETTVETIEDAVESIDDTVESNEAALESLREDADELAAEARSTSAELERIRADVEEEVATLQQDVERLEDRVPDYDVDERFSDVDERLAEIEDELAEVGAFADSLKSAFND